MLARGLAARAAAPAGLLADLAGIDRSLTRLIDLEWTEDLPAGLLRERVGLIKSHKLDMVDQFFAQPVYGVKFSEVFRQLDCLDSELYLGLGAANHHADHHDVANIFKLGQKCKQKLEKELIGSDVPHAMFADLAGIDRSLTRLIDLERTEDLPAGLLRERVGLIKSHKLDMVDQFFAQPVYGVKFSEVFRQLDCLDSELYLGLGAANHHADHHDVANIFKLGQKCKQKLEAELPKAAPQPLSISAIKAVFSEPDRATTYNVPTVTDSPGATFTYQWTLTLQAVDPSKPVDSGCNNHGVLSGSATTFVWHHGNSGDPIHDDGCDHTKQGSYGHQGLISVIVTDNRGAKCSATYKGTFSSDANAAAGINAASKPDCIPASP